MGRRAPASLAGKGYGHYLSGLGEREAAPALRSPTGGTMTSVSSSRRPSFASGIETNEGNITMTEQKIERVKALDGTGRVFNKRR